MMMGFYEFLIDDGTISRIDVCIDVRLIAEDIADYAPWC